MAEITRKLEFDAAHRIVGHESKCRAIHGHRYIAEITVSSQHLDDVGRVIDFSVVKREIGGWIDANWDHTIILDTNDPFLAKISHIQGLANQDKPPYILPGPPTVELMADYLFHKSSEIMSRFGVKVERIRLYETPNCWADAQLACKEV